MKQITVKKGELMHQTALKYDVEIKQTGKLELSVPFQVGTYITVFVISEQETIDNFDDILAATNSSLDFWDNHFDDEDWNYVPTR